VLLVDLDQLPHLEVRQPGRRRVAGPAVADGAPDALDDPARRHQHGALRHHLLRRLLVEVGAVLDGVAAGAEGGADAGDAVAVGGDGDVRTPASGGGGGGGGGGGRGRGGGGAGAGAVVGFLVQCAGTQGKNKLRGKNSSPVVDSRQPASRATY
jgi:hypothetical protein